MGRTDDQRRLFLNYLDTIALLDNQSGQERVFLPGGLEKVLRGGKSASQRRGLSEVNLRDK